MFKAMELGQQLRNETNNRLSSLFWSHVTTIQIAFPCKCDCQLPDTWSDGYSTLFSETSQINIQ